MSDSTTPTIAVTGLIVGAVLGMAGTFAPSASLRGLAWGLDGTALIVATALLTIHHFRRGNDVVAAGFLVFVVGEALILSGAAMDLDASAPSFAAGVGLWAASLAMVSASSTMPTAVRGTGLVALPFFAYPFLAATLFGWAWVHYRSVTSRRGPPRFAEASQ